MDTKKSSAKKSNINKTMHCLKAAFKDVEFIKAKLSHITWKKLTLKKTLSGIRHFHISGSDFMFMRTPKGIVTAIAPVVALLFLALTICFWTLSDKPLEVSVDGEQIATIEDEAVLTQANMDLHNALAETKEDRIVTPVLQISYPTITKTHKSDANEVYEKLVDHSEEVVADAGGLFIDGEFYGAVEDATALNQALIDILEESKSQVSQPANAFYNNHVEVVCDVYSKDNLKSVHEIIKETKSHLSIRLEVEMTATQEKDFEIKYEKDPNELKTYKKVKVKGEKGIVKANLNVVFVDGVQVDTREISSVVIKEPVTQVTVVGTQESFVGTEDFVWPVPSSRLCTTLFEERWEAFHTGIDVAGAEGEDIIASDSGTVCWAGDKNDGFGYYVIIDHGNGFRSLYAHCKKLHVKIGDQVKKGDLIAEVGSTGDTTGPHLHFEIIKDGKEIDPLKYMTPTEVDRSL